METHARQKQPGATRSSQEKPGDPRGYLSKRSGRDESGWCSDVPSSSQAWKDAVVRVPLGGGPKAPTLLEEGGRKYPEDEEKMKRRGDKGRKEEVENEIKQLEEETLARSSAPTILEDGGRKRRRRGDERCA